MVLGRAARSWAGVAVALSATLLVTTPARGQSGGTPASPSVVAVDGASPGRLTLDVIVPRRDVAAAPLDAAAFEVTPGRVESVTHRAADTLDIVLVVDDRRSIGAIGLANVKEVTRQLVAALGTGTTLAINSVGGEGGLPTKDLPAAAQFVDSLVLADTPATATPASTLRRVAALLQPGAGRTTHVVVVAGDSAPVRSGDEAAVRTSLAGAKAELSVVSVARRVDQTIAALVTPAGAAVADTGGGLSLLAPRVIASLTSRYSVVVGGAAAGTATLRVRSADTAADPVPFSTDGSPVTPVTPAASATSRPSGAPTTPSATTATTPGTAPAATAPGATAPGATTTSGAPATTAPARVTATTRATTGAAVTTVAPRSGATTSRARQLLVTLAAAGVIGGIGSVLVRARRPRSRRARRHPWVEFDTLRLSTESDDMWRAGRELRLDHTERHVLRAMTSQPGHIFTRDDIARIAWPDRDSVSPRLVSTLMDHLQRTVDGIDDAPLVHVVRGAGYVLSDPADTDGEIAGAVKPRPPQYAAPAHRRASRR